MNLVFLGYPGSGKGTQAKMLAGEFGFKHVSTGEIFREIMEKNTPAAAKIRSYMDTGNLVPDDMTVEAVSEKLKEEQSKGFILDGFPRNLNQAVILDRELERENKKIDIAVFFDLTDEVSIKRLSARRICSRCNRGYNMISQKPGNDEICDFCGVKLIQRHDDDLKTIRRRFDVYKKQTSLVIDHYTRFNKLVRINADNAIDVVFTQVKKIISAKDGSASGMRKCT